MKSEILEKYNVFKFPKEVSIFQFLKHYACVKNKSILEIGEILALLNEEGIVLDKPIHMQIMANRLDVMVNNINVMKEDGEIDAYKENPLRINIPYAYKIIRYLKSIGEPYKTDDGKYSEICFNKKAFYQKYGQVDLEVFDINSVENEKESLEPVIETNNYNFEEFKEESNEKESNSFIPFEEVENNHPVVESISDDEYKTLINNEFNNSVVEEEQPVANEAEMILSNPKEIALNDELFDKYNRLRNILQEVLLNVSGVTEIPDEIAQRLLQLITNGVEDDYTALFYSVVYGKELSDEYIVRLQEVIMEKLEDEKSLGRGM